MADMADSRGNLGHLLSKHKKRSIPVEKLHHSSSSETDAGYWEHQIAAHTPLTPTQGPSLLASSSHETKWVESLVRPDYNTRIPTPEKRNRLLESLTKRRPPVDDPLSEMVPFPACGLAEWLRVDARFGNYLSSLFAVGIVWILSAIYSGILVWFYVVLLDDMWKGFYDYRDYIDEYVSDFQKWLDIREKAYLAGKDKRGPYNHGDVLLLSRDLVCFRVPKAYIEQHAPELLKLDHYRPAGYHDFGRIHVMDLEHSSDKIRTFLDFLQGYTFDEIWAISRIEDAFTLRTSLYLMARQYASEATYEQNGHMFTYREWNNRGQMHPMRIFAVACRATKIDKPLAYDAILDFAVVERKTDPSGNARNWMPWFITGISLDAMEAGDFARKMQSCYLDAYVDAHRETWKFIRKTAEERNNGIYHLDAKGRKAALYLLAGEFLKAIARDASERDGAAR